MLSSPSPRAGVARGGLCLSKGASGGGPAGPTHKSFGPFCGAAELSMGLSGAALWASGRRGGARAW